MANYPSWVMEQGLIDGVGRHSVMSFQVPAATAKTYMAAADKTARDATAIGLLFAANLTVTKMSEVYRRVYVNDLESPIAPIADDILRGNKIVVQVQTGPKNLKFTIPARDETAYTQNADELTIDIVASGDFADWIALVESTTLGVDGLAQSVTGAYLVD